MGMKNPWGSGWVGEGAESTVGPKGGQGRDGAWLSRVAEGQFSMVISGTQNSMKLETVLWKLWLQGMSESFPDVDSYQVRCQREARATSGASVLSSLPGTTEYVGYFLKSLL